MKPTSLILAACVIALASCSAFTAPKDPATGIRQDAPTQWQGQPNPLDTPGTNNNRPPSEGSFGFQWMNR